MRKIASKNSQEYTKYEQNVSKDICLLSTKNLKVKVYIKTQKSRKQIKDKRAIFYVKFYRKKQCVVIISRKTAKN